MGRDNPLFEVHVKVRSTAPHLLMVTSKRGTIKHMSSDLAAALGLTNDHDTAVVEDPLSGRPNLGMVDTRAILGAVLAAGMKLQDFMPEPWRHLHPRYLRDLVTRPHEGTPFSCRAGALGPTATPGPGQTLAVMDMKGRTLYVKTAVHTTDETGEMLHVVRLERSSAEEGASERRLRLRVAPDGTIKSAQSQATADLFGLKVDKMGGALLWSYVSLFMPVEFDEQMEAAASDAPSAHASSRFLKGSVQGMLPLMAMRPTGSTSGGADDEVAAANNAKGRRVLDALVKR